MWESTGSTRVRSAHDLKLKKMVERMRIFVDMLTLIVRYNAENYGAMKASF
jgi:hypothetical protein